MKKAFALLLALIMVFVATGALAADIKVLVNGEAITFDRGPQIYDGTVLIPYRFVAEKLGAVVLWDSETRTVFTNMNDTISTMQIGNNKIFTGTTVMTSAVAPMLSIDRTLVSEQILEGFLGAEVSWNEELMTVTITK